MTAQTPADRIDQLFMREALELARRGLFTTTPNPRVGCVLVADGQVIGRGWHERAGLPHAEVLALREAGARARGATAYVSLEPCSHHGRTPPCADALVAAAVARVVVSMVDPFARVSGSGIARLRAAGITVETGVLEDEARELNRGFVKRQLTGRPWLTCKIAATLDGRTALADGRSRWITGPAARREVHGLRARSCAVLTGIGTILADDPRLDVREVDTPRQPLRVVADSRLRIAPDARIFGGGPVLIAHAGPAAEAQRRALEERGAELYECGSVDGRIDLPRLLDELGRRGTNEVLAEGGAQLHGSLLERALVDEVVCYVAPLVLGDAARPMFALGEPADLAVARRFAWTDLRRVGDDLCLAARPLAKAGGSALQVEPTSIEGS